MNNEPNPFAFPMNSVVQVKFKDKTYTGTINGRWHSRGGGIHYSVYADYEHGRMAEWFAERDIKLNPE